MLRRKYNQCLSHVDIPIRANNIYLVINGAILLNSASPNKTFGLKKADRLSLSA